MSCIALCSIIITPQVAFLLPAVISLGVFGVLIDTLGLVNLFHFDLKTKDSSEAEKKSESKSVRYLNRYAKWYVESVRHILSVTNSQTSATSTSDALFLWVIRIIASPWTIIPFLALGLLLSYGTLVFPNTIAVGMLICLVLAFLGNVILATLVEDYPTEITLSGWLRFIVKQTEGMLKDLLLPVSVLLIWIIGVVYSFQELRRIDYSIPQLFKVHPPLLIIAILLSLLSILPIAAIFVLMIGFYLPIIVIVLVFMPSIVVEFVAETRNLLRDQGRFLSMLLNPDLRPQDVEDAVSILSFFRTELGKKQYTRMLSRWLPVGWDWKTLMEAAKEEKGYVREALFKLVEIWQDSMPEP